PQAWQNVKSSPDLNRQTLETILADRALTNLLSLPKVAIIGPANVGKSTLANQLFAQERSITADIPGTTRDWVGEIANIDGLAVQLYDTPGLREAADEIEAAAIERSRGVVDEADLLIVVREPFVSDRSTDEIEDRDNSIVV